ncbi:MAG TPA: deoxyribodipyrimidine photo-lyase, partial [Bdellovibrionales bacterium]|nr:deoxyribodipyrimidine photo-lyase [Bdellovibrionales bacterium]
MATRNPEIVNVFWFRRDLRLGDNTGLNEALSSGKPVLPVFIFDTDILGKLDDRADRRVDFIHRTITDLDKELKQRGSALLVEHGKPVEIFKKLIRKYRVGAVFTNHD